MPLKVSTFKKSTTVFKQQVALIILFSSACFGQTTSPTSNSLSSSFHEKKENKTFISVNGNLGSSFEKLNTGTFAVSGNGSVVKEVKVATGGGFGLDAGVGRKISDRVRLLLHGGFQLSNGRPDIANGVVRFSRLVLRPELLYHIPLNNEFGLELGAGGILGFRQKLKIEDTGTSGGDPMTVSFKNSLGTAGHVLFVHSVENNQFFAGVRCHWLTLHLDKILLKEKRIDLLPEDRARFENRNSGGLNFVVGFRFLI